VTVLTIQFSESVAASLTSADLQLRNLTTSTDIAPASLNLSYDAGTNTATLTFPGLPGQKLPDGRYVLMVFAAGVTDVDGKSLPADYKLNFHVLTGDMNGDAATNDVGPVQGLAEFAQPAGAAGPERRSGRQTVW